ncbi:bifunctional phosphoribosylaminoimidazolecarboxamide formyltransferase/IMP cyclohydrolase [Deinococcus yavapaiensis]|uniref:Bifunctional purine biosynthesis protein PurH n=1 Tax=Deinococcus yavapaiensis KR-236 TaxID=694435 RepID=A0A318SKM3_9DEIO|nr:bifunctional phosphoribosylaminoimidazolecarboxamide formyltransferase/IMP cyclohydrolase [Deinococcus yavapaiensis]PYE54909.1 IMP cyclohydrolase /phosphoribosylaminoimidazolecarboxamide formyltransferase [Deinococcus yavapaiensis KR-236]
MRALLSVSDKTGIVDFARALVGRGYEIISTGGTLNALVEADVPAIAVSDVTSFPEILGGRVKTLHPNIHGGILARRDEEHLAELAAHGITAIDLVCVNLYPFRETIAKGVDLAEALENIDIGGPAMLRAAAKNFPGVIVLVDPADYNLALGGDLNSHERQRLAAKAYAHTSSYDAAITTYLSEVTSDLPTRAALELSQVAELRYGENPHQPAALYRLGSERGPVLDAVVLAGKPMSFNNYADADAAWALVREFEGPACVAVKHANPCGVAIAHDVKTAWERARDADTLSVFGGVVAVNAKVDLEAAQAMRGTFLEVLIAPEVSEEALAWFQAKKPDLRVLVAGEAKSGRFDYRPLVGGFLVQERDSRVWDDLCPEVVTELQPTDQAWLDLAFAWRVGKHARSNCVVLARDGVTVGVGAGAVSRIWAAERAVMNAGERAEGSVLASEAFFPFDDVVRLAASAGVSAIVQPGGAKRDEEVIAACDELGVAMIFTGSRHFKH